MKKKFSMRIMSVLMMLLMMFSVVTPVMAKNGPNTGEYRMPYILFSKMPGYTSQTLIWQGFGKYIPTQVTNGKWKEAPLNGVSYNKATNTLTLNNVNMPDWSLTANEMGDDFKVNVKGSNSLLSLTVYGAGWGGNVEFGGNGTLVLNKNKTGIEESTIQMEAECTEGRITIGPNVKLTAYKGKSYALSITNSSKSSAPVNVQGKLAKQLTLSKDSGKNTGNAYLSDYYSWHFTNDVISVNTGTPSQSGNSKTCTVTFNANGGTKLSKKSISVVSGKAIGKLPTVGKKNYAFKGWYTKKKGGSKVASSTKIRENQTLYAQWTNVSVKAASAPTVKKAGSGKMSVTLKKVSGAKGYQIVYSTSSKFKGSKSVTTTSLKKTISKLKKGKTYYVRIRAYKADSMKNKVYGKYSKTVKVKL